MTRNINSVHHVQFMHVSDHPVRGVVYLLENVSSRTWLHRIVDVPLRMSTIRDFGAHDCTAMGI